MMFSIAIFVVMNFALIGSSLGQLDLQSDDVLQKAAEAANIPGLNASALPVEEAKTAIKKKCEQNGGPNAYNRAENAAKDIESCIRNLVNVTVLHEEIEQAKPTGDLDIVFKKYCNKRSTLKNCVKNFTNEVEPCLAEQEQKNVRVIQNITDSLLNFVCFKEGDRIALFIAAGGPECFSSQQNAIQNCLNTTFGSYIPAEGLSPPTGPEFNQLPLLLLDTKECTDIQTLQTCVVAKLEECHDPTPGNIVNSLFDFIKKVTPCENLLSKARAAASVAERNLDSSSAKISAHFFTILSSFFILREVL